MRLFGTCLIVLAVALATGTRAWSASYAKGVDVSNWQGTVDWIQVGDDGYTFMFAKATEGTTFTDITYAVNRAGAQGVGMRLGAYHFARPAGSGDAARRARSRRQITSSTSRSRRAETCLPFSTWKPTAGSHPRRS